MSRFFLHKILPKALALCIIMCAIFAHADVVYEVSDGEAYVSGCTADTTGHVEISSTYSGYPVTKIGDEAFSGCSGFTSISIPSSVTAIGDEAFASCTGLTSITIGNGVTVIRDKTFSKCSGLTSITIPDGVTEVGAYAFSGCTGLTKILVGSKNSYFRSIDGILFNNSIT